MVTIPLTLVKSSRTWRESARCAEVDPELFFPLSGESSEPAKKICRRCEVRADCLQDSLDRGERSGVRGGLTARERRSLRRRRRQEAAA
ncbi:WhiB family transcriptional regulator [Actinomadura sp. GTD37]|uniref:WhiB family transcriptional regulator n=1 Tax=Actinomadura sp. GTD37 TaxID=1778030 RepID=UPI0035BFD39C